MKREADELFWMLEEAGSDNVASMLNTFSRSKARDGRNERKQMKDFLDGMTELVDGGYIAIRFRNWKSKEILLLKPEEAKVLFVEDSFEWDETQGCWSPAASLHPDPGYQCEAVVSERGKKEFDRIRKAHRKRSRN